MATSAMSFAMRTAHEDDDTILDFEVEFDLSSFFLCAW